MARNQALKECSEFPVKLGKEMEISTNMAPLIGRDQSKQFFCRIDTWNCLSQSKRFKILKKP